MQPKDISFIARGHRQTFGRLKEGNNWQLGLIINGVEVDDYLEKDSLDGGSYFDEIIDLYPGIIPEAGRNREGYIVKIPLKDWEENALDALDLIDEFFDLNKYRSLLNNKQKTA